MSWLASGRNALFVILALVGLYVSLQVRLWVDPRPRETVDAVSTLAERDDLNLLLVLVDTLRADRLGAYGYERETSAGIDYLAETGVRFANNRAQSSWTKSSMASLWTSLYPNRTGVLRATDSLSQAARTPVEILQEAGFATAGIWRNGWVAPRFQFDQGFDLYQNPFVRQAPAALRREVRAGRIDGTDIDALYSAREFLRTHRDDRFFLYVHLMDVHQYVTTEELAVFGTSHSDAYDNAILWVDHQVRALLGALEEFRLRDRTLVVLASDHGEAFGEHGGEGHARDLHAEVTHTPWVLGFPFRLDPGVVVETPTENVDLWPTILDLLGLPALEPSDGTSRVPEILGEAAPDTESSVDVAYLDRSWGRLSREADPILALREGNLRVIYSARRPETSLLFDLSSDPAEQRNLYGRHPESERMAELARRELARSAALEVAPPVEIDELSLKQLRALGYAVE